MASGRKRKYGIVTNPSEDELNSVMLHNVSTSSSVSQTDDNNEDFHSEQEVFHDPVHGHYELPTLLLKILDTPQIQRLRRITQMGGTSYLYTSACHTRFEHSLGVAYLAGKLCKVLRKRQPELQITSKDILCLQIAGLCHDIGHGPFSHLFAKLFIPKLKPGINWSHEDASIDMFNHMLKENDIESFLMDNGLDENDIIFIKELICDPPDINCSQEWPYKGRSKDKSFLYEIVSNKTSGNDVDKWDYLARDCFHLGIPNSFDYRRYLKFVRVVSCDGRLQICTRDKEVGTLYEMFHVRDMLHRRTCLHTTGVIIKLMLCDALLKANDHILIPGENGDMCTIGDCISDMHAYTKLTDDVIMLIQISQDERLKEAQEILDRLHKRDLYKLVGDGILPSGVCKSENELRNEIYNEMENIRAVQEDFVVHIAKFNYGKDDDNPVNYARFYEKDRPDVGIRIKPEQISLMLPRVYSEKHIRFFCKRNDHFLIQHASVAFKQWYDSTLDRSIDEGSSAS